MLTLNTNVCNHLEYAVFCSKLFQLWEAITGIIRFILPAITTSRTETLLNLYMSPFGEPPQMLSVF